MTSASMEDESWGVGGKWFLSHRFWGRVVLGGGRVIPYDEQRVAWHYSENRLATASYCLDTDG